MGEGYTKEYLAQGVRQQYVWRCSLVILKSELGNDKAFIKSPPSESKSKLGVWEPSELTLGRKRGGMALNEKKRKPANETVSQRKCKWMHSNEEWHQKTHNELRLLDLRGVQSSGGYIERVCALCLHILLLCEDATACPCVTHRNSCPPYSGGPLCLLYVYDRKMPLDEDADSTLVIPQVIALFDKGDSWLTSLCPSACVEKTHVFSPSLGQE